MKKVPAKCASLGGGGKAAVVNLTFLVSQAQLHPGLFFPCVVK